LFRGRSDFKKGYQPGINVVKDENGDVAGESHSICAMWGNKNSHLLKLHGINDVRQSEKHKAELLVPELAPMEFEVATERLKIHKSFHSDQIPAELFLEYFFPRFLNLLILLGIILSK
jgi:hypothetical protein